MVYCVVIERSNKIRLQQRRFFFLEEPKGHFWRKWERVRIKLKNNYLAAISRADIMDSVIENGRICSDLFFFTGKPAAFFDNTSPNWLPTENLSHSKVSRKHVATCKERYQRKKVRFGQLNDQAQQTSQSKAGMVDGTCNDALNNDSSEPARLASWACLLGIANWSYQPGCLPDTVFHMKRVEKLLKTSSLARMNGACRDRARKLWKVSVHVKNNV